MSHDSLVTKPASGHWTDAYPELGRGPVSLEDCVSEEFYEKEREHVFKKTWLYMGRVERVPKSGSYFTRELRFLNTSIIIVRTTPRPLNWRSRSKAMSRPRIRLIRTTDTVRMTVTTMKT